VIIFEDNYATYSSTWYLNILRFCHSHFLQVFKCWFNYWVNMTDLFICNCKGYFHTIETDLIARWSPYTEKVHSLLIGNKLNTLMEHWFIYKLIQMRTRNMFVSWLPSFHFSTTLFLHKIRYFLVLYTLLINNICSQHHSAHVVVGRELWEI
jgi:hypothetical protein